MEEYCGGIQSQQFYEPVHSSCRNSSALTSDLQSKEKLLSTKRKSQNRRRCLDRVHLPALLLILAMVPAGSLSGFSRVASAILTFQNPCQAGIGFTTAVDYTETAFIVQNALLVYIGFPIAGWLADTRLGQFKVVYGSIWCFWCGLLSFGVGCILRLLEPCDGPTFISGKYVFNIVALVFISLGAMGFFPNILVLLIDQLPGVSNTQLKSYINWFAWCLYLGFFVDNWMESGSQLYPRYIDEWFYIAVLIEFTVFSAILIVLFFFKRKFIISHSKANPYYNVYKVLEFARKHKVPLRRSAFTYWENKLPSRIDLAKDKYGGPFTHENVEDVKTLLRILGVFLSLAPFFIGYVGPLSELIPYVNHFAGGNVFLRLFVYPMHTMVTLVAIPVMELLILPMCPKLEFFLTNTLRWLLLACVFLLLCNGSLMIIAAVASIVFDENFCFFQWNVQHAKHAFPFQWLFIPSFLWAIAEYLLVTSIFKFICSQSPHTMRGMLLGLVMFLHGFYTQLGLTVTLILDKTKPDQIISCGFLYWLVMFLWSLAGCILFGIIAYFYRRRVREEVLDERGLIESVYERELSLEAEVCQMFASHQRSETLK